MPIENCKLQIANCKLQIANCKLQIANCKFLILVVDKYSEEINLSQRLNIFEVRVTTRGYISVYWQAISKQPSGLGVKTSTGG